MRNSLAAAGRMALIVLAWPAWTILGAPFVAERLHIAFGPQLLAGAAAAVVIVAGAGAYHAHVTRS
jgi:hypothetical protein